jgi:DNA polymerase-3 subunit delta
MIIKGAQIARAVASFDPRYRLYFLFGPDEATSRAQADALGKTLGADAERIDLDGSTLKEDPARLSDEAASFSMFASARWVRVKAGDEALAAVEALLESPPTDTPVVLISGDLKKASALFKRLENDPVVLGCQNYFPDAREAWKLVIEIGRTLGLRIENDVAQHVVGQCAEDQAVIRQELIKFALYLDATAAAPKDLTSAVIDAIGAESDEGNIGTLVNAVMDGQTSKVVGEMALLGDDAVRILNQLAARVLLLVRLRADVDSGTTVVNAVERGARGLFWKEKPFVTQQLQRWSASRLATAHSRLLAARRAVMASSSTAGVLVEAELIAIARAAAASRR